MRVKRDEEWMDEGRDNNKRNRCCRSILVAGLVVLLVVGGIVVIWLVLPTRESEPVLDAQASSPPITPSPPVAPSSAPSPTPFVPKYEFQQCTDPLVCCNGLSTICDLGVDEVMFATAHNANADAEYFPLSFNHRLPLELALQAGYRGLNLDIGKCSGSLQLIHGFCAFGTRNATEVLVNVVDFMNQNPTEIVVITLQLEQVTIDELEDLLQGVEGLTDMLYDHQPNVSWPTLGNLIENDKRIILFHLNGPNCQDEDVICPPGFHDWFAYAAETEFDFSNMDLVRDTENSCKITRGGSGTRDFFGVNVFVTLPDELSSAKLNKLDSLQSQIQACSEMNGGLDVNFVLVDFWNEGDLPQVVQLHNDALGQEG